MNIIDFENINVGYDEKIILKNITIKIKEKEHWDIDELKDKIKQKEFLFL